MSLIEGIYLEQQLPVVHTQISYLEGQVKQVRMAHLACIGQDIFFSVINVSSYVFRESQGQRSRRSSSLLCLANLGSDTIHDTQLHSDLVRTTIFKDFVEFEGVSKSVSSFDIIDTASISLIIPSKGSVTSLMAVSLEQLSMCISFLIYPFQVTPRRWLDQVRLSQDISYYNR